ncbi:MAG: glycosyltransferase family 4 protein [bacterium]
MGFEKQNQIITWKENLHKIKIIVLGTRGFPHVQGGVEKHCEELYPRLVKLGCDITVFTRTPYIPAEERLTEWRGIKFIHLWCPRKKSFEAIIHTFLGVIVSWRKSPDILHIHAIGPSLLVPLARLLGLKVVMTHHGPDYERKKWGSAAKLVLRAGEYMGISFANRIIAISRGIKQRLEKKTCSAEKSGYIPNGVTFPDIVSEGKALERFSLEPRKYVFTAARFVPEKGLHDLIKAYRRIENSEFKLVIAGDADHETEYSRQLKRLAKETAGVILTGFISGEPLQELFSNAGLFVLPSYYEGLPIALLEALSYGLPVLASDIPQNREVHLPDFRFFETGNVNDLSKTMINLFNLGISEEEKNSQKKNLKENYNWDKIAAKTCEVYKQVVVFH